MKRWLKRLLGGLLLAELVYLLLVNAALNLPLTQDLLNGIKPDMFAIHWDRAWSWYPFRVHARGVMVNGQSASQQWQAQGDEASASIALLPLLNKTVVIYNGQAVNGEYRQRPRVKADHKYAKYRSFFPEIDGRDPLSPARVSTGEETVKPGKGWSVELSKLHASGLSKVWILQFRGEATGDLTADLSYQSRGGPFSLSNARADIQWQGVYANGDELVSRRGSVNGTVAFEPFVPSETPGLKVLGYLDVDADLELDVESLDFLDFYLQRFSGMQVDGAGLIAGHLNFGGGRFLSGTQLSVAARALSLQLLAHRAEGDGGIKIEVATDAPQTLQMETRFDHLSARHVDSSTALFNGEGLSLALTGSAVLIGDRQGGQQTAALRIPEVKVADLSAWQRYLLPQWPVTLHGGNGLLQASAELSLDAFNAQLELHSNDADVAFQKYRVTTGLELQLKAEAPTLAKAQLDISGSSLRLDETSLATGGKGKSDPLRAEVVIDSGSVGLELPAAAGPSGESDGNLRALLSALKRVDAAQLVAGANAELDIRGSISRLGWINLFISNKQGLALSGSGDFDAHAVIDVGWPAPGSRLKVESKHLGLSVLDYQATGDGSLAMTLSGASGHPDFGLEVALKQGLFRRKGERQAFVDQVALQLHATGKDFSREGLGDDLSIRLQIPSARVRDMSVYNQYFPAASPLKFSDGRADLMADVLFKRESADGVVKLKTQGLKAQLNDQAIAGELRADIVIDGGRPADMLFDIAGSTLLFDQVRVSGAQQSFDQQDWSMRLTLNQAEAVWRKPIRLDVEADISISDTRPFVAVLANHRGKHGLLEKMLTTEDIDGTLQLNIADGRARIPYAFAGSDKLAIGAKGMFGKDSREAMFYGRYKRLGGVLKIEGERKNFDIIRARHTFDSYVPGKAPVFNVDVEDAVEQVESLQGL